MLPILTVASVCCCESSTVQQMCYSILQLHMLWCEWTHELWWIPMFTYYTAVPLHTAALLRTAAVPKCAIALNRTELYRTLTCSTALSSKTHFVVLHVVWPSQRTPTGICDSICSSAKPAAYDTIVSDSHTAVACLIDSGTSAGSCSTKPSYCSATHSSSSPHGTCCV
jgi:hypothetical protein